MLDEHEDGTGETVDPEVTAMEQWVMTSPDATPEIPLESVPADPDAFYKAPEPPARPPALTAASITRETVPEPKPAPPSPRPDFPAVEKAYQGAPGGAVLIVRTSGEANHALPLDEQSGKLTGGIKVMESDNPPLWRMPRG